MIDSEAVTAFQQRIGDESRYLHSRFWMSADSSVVSIGTCRGHVAFSLGCRLKVFSRREPVLGTPAVEGFRGVLSVSAGIMLEVSFD